MKRPTKMRMPKLETRRLKRTLTRQMVWVMESVAAVPDRLFPKRSGALHPLTASATMVQLPIDQTAGAVHPYSR